MSGTKLELDIDIICFVDISILRHGFLDELFCITDKVGQDVIEWFHPAAK